MKCEGCPIDAARECRGEHAPRACRLHAEGLAGPDVLDAWGEDGEGEGGGGGDPGGGPAPFAPPPGDGWPFGSPGGCCG